MKIRKVFLSLIVSALSLHGSDQAQEPAAVAQLRAAVERGHAATSILDAGRSGNSVYIRYLKTLLRKPERKKYGDGREAQMALAKLGSVNELQQIMCEALYGEAPVQYDAFQYKLPYVEGWASISVLTRFIGPDAPAPTMLSHSHTGGDMFYMPAEKTVLKILPKVVPNPPFAAPSPIEMQLNTTPQQQAWLKWINDHQESLNKLEPTGTGIDTSERTCKRVIKKDELLRSSR